MRARRKMSAKRKGELAAYEPGREPPLPTGSVLCPVGTGVGLEIVARPVRIPRGGRKPLGWMGGARVMEEVERAPDGMAVRMPLPEAVPYDRVRWGIYAAARLRRLPVSIVRQDGFVHIWRLGFHCWGR